MGEVIYLNSRSRRYAERQASNDPDLVELPQLALHDIRACMELDSLGLVTFSEIKEERIDAIENLGTAAVLLEIGSFYGFSPQEIQAIYDSDLADLEREIAAE